jgi:hypothetical protein
MFIPFVFFPTFPEAQSLGERDTGFKIVLSQRTEKPRGLQASITTTSVYPCEGYTVRSRVRWERDTVSITVLGLLRPSPCVKLASEATSTAYLGDLRGGSYIIRLYYRGDVDLHKVMITKGKISVVPLRNAFTEFSINE